MPFYFANVMPLPGGRARFTFKDLRRKDSNGLGALSYSPATGEEIGKTGWIVKSYEKKTERRKVAGARGDKALEREFDASVATVSRKADGKTILLVINQKRTSLDVQAKLAYTRGATKEFDVVPGSEITLNGVIYRVTEVKALAKGGSVTVASQDGRETRTLEALEP